MNVLLITYELNAKPKEEYTELYSTIKKSNYWWHYLENTWLIATETDPKEWHDKLENKIFHNDRLLIIEVKPNYDGWLSRDAWKWIKQYLG